MVQVERTFLDVSAVNAVISKRRVMESGSMTRIVRMKIDFFLLKTNDVRELLF